MATLAVVNHIQYPDKTGGIVYCHLLDRIVDWNAEHYYVNCCGNESGEPCPYAVGRGYDGSGIENQFWDPTLVPFDPVETITSAGQVQALFKRTRGLEKKTGLEEGDEEYMTVKNSTPVHSTLTQLARTAFKQQPRTKWAVALDGRKKGMMYLGGDVPFEITTRDPDLERLALMVVTNPIESSAGTSKIGDENFPEVARAFFEESGYELEAIK